MNQDRCVKLMDAPVDKAAAASLCLSGTMAVNGSLPGSLFTPKSRQEQHELEAYLKMKAVTDDIYLGITKNSDNHWIYDDDQSPVFTQRELMRGA